ncbi:enoyl-CoA hydratase/isomerase family protein [Alphaproteobacteria bacterium LSUCC0684]
MPAPHVIIDQQETAGRIILSRPEALNAVSREMCDLIIAALLAWADDEAIDRVVITAAPGRAFCAGGDVRSIIPLIEKNPELGDAYFATEYTLDVLIAAFPKPVITIADGLTMGGGAGLLVNASHPVITDAMDFSMPETAIGLFPDVGASLFYRRPPGAAGLFLGMTGWRIGAGDMIALGIVPQAVSAADLEAVLAAVLSCPADAITETLTGVELAPGQTPVADAAGWIDQHFSKADPVVIRASLEGDDHPFAERARQALDTRCPLSIALTHRLLTDPALCARDIVDAIRLDYRLACRMLRHPDFISGVRAVLIDKHNQPLWQPSTLDGVTNAMVDAIVSPEDSPQLPLPERVGPITL